MIIFVEVARCPRKIFVVPTLNKRKTKTFLANSNCAVYCESKKYFLADCLSLSAPYTARWIFQELFLSWRCCLLSTDACANKFLVYLKQTSLAILRRHFGCCNSLLIFNAKQLPFVCDKLMKSWIFMSRLSRTTELCTGNTLEVYEKCRKLKEKCIWEIPPDIIAP